MKPLGYISQEQLDRWEALRGTAYEVIERCYMPYSTLPFESDVSSCMTPIYSAPQVLGLQDQLAASQINEQRLREALELIQQTDLPPRAFEISCDALAHPSSTSALDELKAGYEALLAKKDEALLEVAETGEYDPDNFMWKAIALTSPHEALNAAKAQCLRDAAEALRRMAAELEKP